MHGWKEWYDEQWDGDIDWDAPDDREEVWRELAQMSPEEEEAMREFNEETPLPDDDKEQGRGWTKDELPF